MYKPYALLSQHSQVPPKVLPQSEALEWLSAIPNSEPVAIDFETRGLDASDPALEAVAIGIAYKDKCTCLPLPPASVEWLGSWFRQHPITAFNMTFDGAWFYRVFGWMPDMHSCTYGLFKQLASEGWIGQRWSLETVMEDLLGWPESTKTAMHTWLTDNKLKSKDMWQAPWEILGHYCALDAGAAWQAYEVMRDVANKFDTLPGYHRQDFINEVKLLILQQFRGIQINSELLSNHIEELTLQMAAKVTAFLNHDDVAPHIELYNIMADRAWKEAHPKSKKEGPKFNLNSKPQLAWLFYERLGFRCPRKTATGRASVDKKILPTLGEPGQLLHTYNILLKEQGYAKGCREAMRDGVIHPKFKCPGTLTGRLSGRDGINLQQLPKSRGYLSCWEAREGHKLVSMDFTALEPKVLAWFSQDKNMMKLYSKSAKFNDIYLFNACHMGALGDHIKQYYDPDNPTEESISAAKKLCKKERSVAKVVTLAANYGAGPFKIHQTLNEGGFDISLAEVEDMHRDYWELYIQIKKFGSYLQREWRKNGGWIFNGRGRPLAVDHSLTKDLVNRFVQSTGHDILMRLLLLLDNRQPPGTPWIVDFHDELIYEVQTSDVVEFQTKLSAAIEDLNDELGWDVHMGGDIEVVNNLAEIKL